MYFQDGCVGKKYNEEADKALLAWSTTTLAKLSLFRVLLGLRILKDKVEASHNSDDAEEGLSWLWPPGFVWFLQ